MQDYNKCVYKLEAYAYLHDKSNRKLTNRQIKVSGMFLPGPAGFARVEKIFLLSKLAMV